MTIIHKSIRIIDYEAQQVTPRETPETFDTYVAELINHISGNTSVREYKTRSNATEVIGCILSMCANQTDENYVSGKMDIMAHRLLLKETEAQKQIHRTKTTVQKGSLVQVLLFDENAEKYEYLLAKVEHTKWVDDSDFTFKTGFQKTKRLCGNRAYSICLTLLLTSFMQKSILIPKRSIGATDFWNWTK